MNRSLTGVVFMVLATRAVVSITAQTPSRTTPIYIDAAEPPGDVAGFVRKATLTVRVLLRSVSYAQIASNAGAPPQSKVTAAVEEVYAKDSKDAATVEPGTELTFLIPGGDFDRGDYIERSRVAGAPDMQVGKEYVVFSNPFLRRTATYRW